MCNSFLAKLHFCWFDFQFCRQKWFDLIRTFSPKSNMRRIGSNASPFLPPQPPYRVRSAIPDIPPRPEDRLFRQELQRIWSSVLRLGFKTRRRWFSGGEVGQEQGPFHVGWSSPCSPRHERCIWPSISLHRGDHSSLTARSCGRSDPPAAPSDRNGKVNLHVTSHPVQNYIFTPKFMHIYIYIHLYGI